MAEQVQADTVYQHYKGSLYKVICIAQNANSDGRCDEPLVVYQNVKSNQWFVRSVTEFTAAVPSLNDSGLEELCPRFRLVASDAELSTQE
jgi:hypothetical protein